MGRDEVDTVRAAPEAGDPPLPPVRRTPSMRPALVVVGIAAGILVLFGALAVASGHGTPPPSRTGPARVHGTTLRAVAATRALAPIEHPGTPPDDVLDALVLPEGAVARGHQDNNTGTTQYDEQMTFSLARAEATVVDFYKVELKAKGWSVFDVGTVNGQPGAVEVLAQKGSSDGWYWEAGAVVSPTTFTRSGPHAGAESTRFTLRLFQESDDD